MAPKTPASERRPHPAADWLAALGLTASAVGAGATDDDPWQPDEPDRYCRRCGVTVGPAEAGPRGCSACRSRRLPWQRVVRLGAYQPPLNDWIIAMKFARQWAWAQWFGRALADAARADPPAAQTGPGPEDRRPVTPNQDSDGIPGIVVPVPLHWRRRLGRGYDQSGLIAERFAAAMDLPLAPLLRRTRHTAAQSLLTSQSARNANVRAAFAFRQRVNLAGWSVWLVDDVLTSGATARRCAQLLRRAGATSVNLAVVACATHLPRRAEPADRRSTH